MTTDIFSLHEYSSFDSAYWGMGIASDGAVYFGLCSHMPGKSAGLFRYDKAISRVEPIANISTTLGNMHGKIHTPIIEGKDAKMYFGTHFAYPYGDPSQEVDYEGGHLLAYDPKDGSVEDFGIAHEGEGLLTLALDKQRHIAYMLTVPSSLLIACDLQAKEYRQIGKIPSKGSVCRTIAVDKRGVVYGSFEDNGLFLYDPHADSLVLKEHFFPSEEVVEWNDKTRGGVNKIGRNVWRCVAYDEKRDSLYGIYAASSRCFSIDCRTLTVRFYDPLLPKKYGSADKVYPTLSMSDDENNILYVPADGMFDYCRSNNLNSMSHLMRFNKKTGDTEDAGYITDGSRMLYGVAGAASRGGDIYLLGAVTTDEQRSALSAEDRLFFIKNKPFDLAFIKITL